MYYLNQVYGLKPQWNSLELHNDALKKNYKNPEDTRRFNVYMMSVRRRLTLVNARCYDDILGVCWSVPKMPSHALIILLCTDLVYFILKYLLSMLAIVTPLILGFYWNKSQVFHYYRKSTFKKTFFTLQNLTVLSTVMCKTFLEKIDVRKGFNMCNSYDFLNLSPPFA